MKKVKILILIAVLLVCGTGMLSAQVLSGWWTGGNWGFNGYFSPYSDEHFLMDIDVLSLTFKYNNSGLLLSLTPVHLDSCCEDSDTVQKERNIVSAVNLKVGFDLLSSDYELDLVPYVSANWDPFKPLTAYRAEAGLELNWYSDIVLGYTIPFRVKICSLKAAYGIRRNEPYFTTGIGIDLSAAVYAILFSELDDATK